MSGRVQSVTRQPSDVIAIHPRSDAKVGGTTALEELCSYQVPV